jgi:hypothetical protein
MAALAALHRSDPAPPAETAPAPQALRPSLDCAFHDFMRTRAVVSYYFDVVVRSSEGPRFYERAVVQGDGTRTDFVGDRRPAWGYSLDEDGRATLTSPDESTRIVLYTLKLGDAGVRPVEAGIRSNEYRNLGGECRQTNLAHDTR